MRRFAVTRTRLTCTPGGDKDKKRCFVGQMTMVCLVALMHRLPFELRPYEVCLVGWMLLRDEAEAEVDEEGEGGAGGEA